MREIIFKSALTVLLFIVFIFSFARVNKVDAVNIKNGSSLTQTLIGEDMNDSGNLSGDVMGTSVIVKASDNELDIQRIETEEIHKGKNLSVKITLENLSSTDQQIDKAILSVKKLDGTVELLESIDIKRKVQATDSTEISMEFPNNLAEGKYVGVIELYSKEQLLGKSESVLSISTTTPEVLGASIENSDYLLLLSVSIFVVVLIFSIFLLWKKKALLFMGISLRLFDLVVVIIALSVFGIGVCGGYYLCETFFPYGMYF